MCSCCLRTTICTPPSKIGLLTDSSLPKITSKLFSTVKFLLKFHRVGLLQILLVWKAKQDWTKAPRPILISTVHSDLRPFPTRAFSSCHCTLQSHLLVLNPILYMHQILMYIFLFLLLIYLLEFIILIFGFWFALMGLFYLRGDLFSCTATLSLLVLFRRCWVSR